MRWDKLPMQVLKPNQPQPFGTWEQPNRFVFHAEVTPSPWFSFDPREKNDPLYIYIGKNARVSMVEQLPNVYYQLHEGASLVHFQTLRSCVSVFELEAKAQVQHAFSGILTASLENVTQVHLKGPGASINWQEGLAIHDQCAYQMKIAMHHNAPQTRSTCGLKTVIHGTGSLQGIYEGFVREEAPQSVLHQQNANYLLHPQGKVCMLPWMHIANKNVDASHGTATESFPEDIAFYLQSRGMPPQTAQDLYLNSFLQSPFVGCSAFPAELWESESCPPSSL